MTPKTKRITITEKELAARREAEQRSLHGLPMSAQAKRHLASVQRKIKLMRYGK